MKRFTKVTVLVLLVAMMATMLIGCGAGAAAPAAAEKDLLTKVRESGKLVVCMNVTEPWNYNDPKTGEVTGMGAELIEGFAAKMGVEVEYQPLEFASLIPTIEAGKADILVTNLTRTVERATSKILYTNCVGSAKIIAIVDKASPYKSIAELDVSGVTLTTEAATISEEIAPDVFKNAVMSACNTNADAVAALKAGRADAFITDTDVASAVLAANPDLTFIDEPVFLDTYAFGVKLDASSFTFVSAFNTYLELIKGDGTYGRLYEKYFGAKWTPDYADVAR